MDLKNYSYKPLVGLDKFLSPGTDSSGVRSWDSSQLRPNDIFPITKKHLFQQLMNVAMSKFGQLLHLPNLPPKKIGKKIRLYFSFHNVSHPVNLEIGVEPLDWLGIGSSFFWCPACVWLEPRPRAQYHRCGGPAGSNLQWGPDGARTPAFTSPLFILYWWWLLLLQKSLVKHL